MTERFEIVESVILSMLEEKKYSALRDILTTMNPATRRLIKILPEDAEFTSEMFDLLLGDNLAGRKDYIAENGHLYLDLTDVS